MKISLSQVCIGLFTILIVPLTAQVTIDMLGSSGVPHLELLDNSTGFSRIYFTNDNSTSGQYWSLSAKMGAIDSDSRLQFNHKGGTAVDRVMVMTGEKRVGIGTYSPTARLTLRQGTDDMDMGLRLENNTGAHEANFWMNGSDLHIHQGNGQNSGLVIKPDKNIGIFTSSPQAMVDIDGGLNSPDNYFIVRNNFGAGGAMDRTLLEVQNNNVVYTHKLGVNSSNPSDRVQINSDAGEDALRVVVDGSTKLRVWSNGGTAIGSNNNATPDNGLYVHRDLHVSNTIRIDADDNGQGGNITVRDENGNQMVRIEANDAAGDGAEITLNNEGGNVTIRQDAQRSTTGGGYLSIREDNLSERLQLIATEHVGQGAALYMFNDSDTRTIELDADFNGKGRVITDELEITGGADLSEQFDVIGSQQIVPGMIVSIDPENAGKLKICQQAYDKKVAGVISGANGIRPGMLMGQKGSLADGDLPVALAGRVYTLATNEGGQIEPGDLLTSSSTPGYAMKVNNKFDAHGTIIGKAMTTLDAARGHVLVLINLQ